MVVGDGMCLQLYIPKGWHGHGINKRQGIGSLDREHRMLAYMHNI